MGTDKERGKSMANNNVTRDFAKILGGTVISSTDGSAFVTRARALDVTIWGRNADSPLVLAAMFSYEGADSQGRTLNLGEVPVLCREVNPFIDALRDNGITVAAVHNHWLFERPRLIYIYFQSTEDPLAFARKVAEAFDTFAVRADEDD